MKRTNQKIPNILSSFKVLWLYDSLSQFIWLAKTQGKMLDMLEAHVGQGQVQVGAGQREGVRLRLWL